MDSICSTDFPMYTPSDPIMPSFVLSLNKFGTFTYNVDHCLISPSTHSAFRLFLWFAYLPFSYISSNGLFLGSKYQAFFRYHFAILTPILIPYFLILSHKLAMQHFFLPRNCSFLRIFLLSLNYSFSNWLNQINVDRSCNSKQTLSELSNSSLILNLSVLLLLRHLAILYHPLSWVCRGGQHYIFDEMHYALSSTFYFFDVAVLILYTFSLWMLQSTPEKILPIYLSLWFCYNHST